MTTTTTTTTRQPLIKPCADVDPPCVGLLGESLSGNFSFVFDTTYYNSFIKKITYSTNNYNTDSASISGYFQVSNYQCDFLPENYIYMETNSVAVSDLNLSGRYVSMSFDMERQNVSSYSPKICNVNVDFSFSKKEYDYKTIFKYKNDIYGIQYFLLKEDLDLDFYNYKFVDGEVLVKTLDGNTNTLKDTFPIPFSKFTLFPNLYNEMLTGIKDMELFFDTLMFVTSNYIVFEKLLYSFESNNLSTDPTNSYILGLSSLSSTYCDIWYFENTNTVLTFLMREKYKESKLILIPKVYKLDLVNNNFFEVVIENTSLLNSLTSLDIIKYETPVVTFDNFRKNFNIGSLIFNNIDDMNVLSINVDYDSEKLIVKDFKVISPVDYKND